MTKHTVYKDTYKKKYSSIRVMSNAPTWYQTSHCLTWIASYMLWTTLYTCFDFCGRLIDCGLQFHYRVLIVWI